MDSTDSLLRDLAHELRDALSPIRPALDLMRLKAFEPQLSQTLNQRIQRAVENSLSRLDGFVMAEQYRDGRVILSTAAVPLRQLLQQLAEALPQTLRERCDFTLPDPEARVVIDRPRALPALTSMLENAALAAAWDGRLQVQACAQGARTRVQIAFTPAREGADGLPGFSSYRAHGSSQTALRTAREILRLHGGDLVLVGSPGTCELVADFESAPGAATAVPPGAAASDFTARSVSRPSRVQRVLIVDDSPEVRQGYLEALSALGYSVSEADDAQTALALAAHELPDVALVDIHLPGMNGYQLARHLKALPGSGALRLVMLSGMTLDEVTRRESQAAGFDQCFDKAAGPRALQALLSELP